MMLAIAVFRVESWGGRTMRRFMSRVFAHRSSFAVTVMFLLGSAGLLLAGSAATALATGSTEIPFSGSGVSNEIRALTSAISTPGTIRYEQTDLSMFSYTGTWTTYALPVHSAGSYNFTKTTGSKVTITFHGTGITYITCKDSIYGIAQVSLDGGAPDSVDLIIPLPDRANTGGWLGQQPVWSASGLSNTDPTLVIECTGAKNPLADGKFIGVDAVDVVGYLLTYTAGTGGTISGTNPQTVAYHADGATVTAAPDSGHHFVSWSDGVPTASRTETNVIDNKSVVASFALNTYTITPSASANGTISPSGAQTVTFGSNITFAIAPDAGYHIADVLKDNVSIGASSSVTFSSVTTSHTLSASFAIDTFTVDPSASEHGSISPNVPQIVNYGSDITFAVAPDAHYHIADVLVDGASIGASASVTLSDVTAGHTVAASFAIDTLTITPGSPLYGTISPSDPQSVDYGGTSSFTFTPEAHYRIADVQVDGISVGPRLGYAFDDVTSDHSITASFVLAAKTVTRVNDNTGVALAKRSFPNKYAGVKNLVIATSSAGHRSDSLVAAGLAGAYDAPELIVNSRSIPAAVATAIKAMPHGLKIHIVGNTKAVTTSVRNKLAKISSVGSVDRVSGADRYAVAANVARKMSTVLGSSMPTTTLIADGLKSTALWDCLVGSAVSNRRHFPLLLTRGAAVPSATSGAIADLGLATVYILGSPLAVPDAVAVTLSVPAENRIGGPTHFDTAVELAERATLEGWLAKAQIGFANRVSAALTAGVFMGRRNGAIIYAGPTTVQPVTAGYLTANHYLIDAGWAFGDTSNVSAATRANLQAMIQ